MLTSFASTLARYRSDPARSAFIEKIKLLWQSGMFCRLGRSTSADLLIAFRNSQHCFRVERNEFADLSAGRRGGRVRTQWVNSPIGSPRRMPRFDGLGARVEITFFRLHGRAKADLLITFRNSQHCLRVERNEFADLSSGR